MSIGWTEIIKEILLDKKIFIVVDHSRDAESNPLSFYDNASVFGDM